MAHYVTNDGKLGKNSYLVPAFILFVSEELLIDFQELIGEHSGENMADLVWKSLDQYGLTGRVSHIYIVCSIPFNITDQVVAFMMDNATNNDTLVEAFERRCATKNIKFSTRHSRLRCVPHTIHLAVLQVRYLFRRFRTVDSLR